MEARDALARSSARDMPDFSGCADELVDWDIHIGGWRWRLPELRTDPAMGQKQYGNSIDYRPGMSGNAGVLTH